MKWYRSPLVIGALLINNVLGITQELGLSRLLIPHEYVINAISVVFVVVGLAIAVWARRTLATNWSSNITLKKKHELITTGPYHYVRHPIYTGVLAMFLGTILAVGTVGATIGFALVIGSFWLKWRQEEQLMSQHFPQTYSRSDPPTRN